jgi:hypothetical protein
MASRGLTRYWIEFEQTEGQLLPPGVGYGVGVTAVGRDDALTLVSHQVFGGDSLPKIARLVEDVDVSALDEGHVLPNMEPPAHRGIWFPRGYSA